jgi:hypothetical protein
MLDLSIAFDVIDHPILMEHLQYSYGITGQALTWINSYLSDRSQSVNIGNIVSTEKILIRITMLAHIMSFAYLPDRL